MPCAIAGEGKVKLAPVANDPATVRTSRRLMAAPFVERGDFDTPRKWAVVAEPQGGRFARKQVSTPRSGARLLRCGISIPPKSAQGSFASDGYFACGDRMSASLP